MRYLTRHHVRKIGRECITHWPGYTPFQHRVVVSMAVIKHFLGHRWFAEHFASTQNMFFSPYNSPEPWERIRRINHLADMFLNFQNISGFEESLNKLRTDNIESGYGAFEAAAILHTSGIRFRFVNPQRVKGLDYDLEAYPNDIDTVCIEAKCAMQSTTVTDSWMGNTLRAARRQLPKDKPGVIFVRVPREWGGDDYLKTPFANVATNFLQNTTRVAMIIMHSNTILRMDQIISNMHLMKEFISKNPKFSHAEGWKLSKTKAFESNWQSVAEILWLQRHDALFTIRAWDALRTTGTP